MIKTSVFVVSPDFPELKGWDMLTGELDKSIGKAKELGYDGIEIIMGDPDKFDVELCKQMLKKHQMEIAAINSGGINYFFSASLVNKDPEKVVIAKAKLKKIIDLCAELGCLVQCGVVRGEAWDGITMPEFRRRLVAALKEMAAYAAEKKVQMVIEYTNRWEINTINTFNDAKDIIDRVDSPNVRLLLDTGHSYLEDDPDVYETIRRAKDYVKHFHFHDGDKYPAGVKSNLLDFDKIFEVMKEINYSGFLSDGLMTTSLPDEISMKSTAYQHEMIRKLGL